MREKTQAGLLHRHVLEMNWGRIFPLVDLLRDYSREDLRADALAGITTGVMLVPQGMAYALLAGLPPIVGVYAALLPGLIYAFLGTSRQLSVGPVAMDSMLVAAAVGSIAEAQSGAYVEAAVLLALLVGGIQVAMGLLRLGFLVNFLSVPVISGFTSAAAILIGLSQLKHLLGFNLPSSPELVSLGGALIERLDQTKAEPLIIGVGAIALIVSLKKWAKKVPGALVGVAAAGGVVWALGWGDKVSLVGDVPRGLPGLRVPAWDLELVQTLFPSALTIALVSFMESISVGKIYARKNGYQVIPDRELIAVGWANAVGAMFQGYPVAGGFSRTAVNGEAGARTPVAVLITSALVAAALLFLTPLFYHVPKAALAAVIVSAVVNLIDYKEATHLNKVKRSDMVLLFVTFASTLSFGILKGIAIGVVASLLWLIRNTARPHVAVLGRVPGTKLFRNIRRNSGLVTYQGVLIVRMDAQLYFGNATFLRRTLKDLEEEHAEPLKAVVLDCSAINAIDASAEATLSDMLGEYRSRGVEFYLAGVKGPVRDVLEASGLSEEFGGCGQCLTVLDAVAMADPPEVEPQERGPEAGPQSAGVRASGASARL